MINRSPLSKKISRILIIIAIMCTVLIAAFFVPKQVFFWLSVEMIEKVEHRYDYDSKEYIPHYVEISTEDKVRIISALQKMKYTYPVRSKVLQQYCGSINPFRVTLKNGYSFCYCRFADFGLIFLKNGEHVAQSGSYHKVYDILGIVLKVSRDRSTKEISSDLGLFDYNVEYGYPPI